jgi:hypothetical protein
MVGLGIGIGICSEWNCPLQALRGPFIASMAARRRLLSAGRNTGSGADSVDTVEVVRSALIFWPGSKKERNFSATGSVS